MRVNYNSRHFIARLALSFIILLAVMHITGIAASGLPYILNATITSGIVVSTLLLLVKWREGHSFKDTATGIGLGRTSFEGLLPGIYLSGALLAMYPGMGYILNMELLPADDWLPNLCGTFLTGGITEEVLFRGFLFGRLRQRFDFRKAALVSTGLFALAHLLLFTYLEWPIALFSTILAIACSVPLAYLYEKSCNTIWSSALVHTIIRTIGLVVTTSSQDYQRLAMWWIIGSVFIPYVVLAFYKDFRELWRRPSIPEKNQ